MRVPEVPSNVQDPIALRRFLQDMRSVVVGLQDGMQEPGRATNLTITPLPGGNRLDWTRVDRANGYRVRVSDINQWDATVNQSVDVGDSNSYTDDIGKGGVTRWYWVQSIRNGVPGEIEGPVKGITLGLAVEATLPGQPPVPNPITDYDTELGYPVEGKYNEHKGGL